MFKKSTFFVIAMALACTACKPSFDNLAAKLGVENNDSTPVMAVRGGEEQPIQESQVQQDPSDRLEALVAQAHAQHQQRAQAQQEASQQEQEYDSVLNDYPIPTDVPGTCMIMKQTTDDLVEARLSNMSLEDDLMPMIREFEEEGAISSKIAAVYRNNAPQVWDVNIDQMGLEAFKAYGDTLYEYCMTNLIAITR